MLTRITELLSKCGSEDSVMPPTQLYNEGWLLILILDWFDRNRSLPHPLSFLPGARWYSEALLPSRFQAQWKGDDRAESHTHADGVIGHFSIQPGMNGEARLQSNAKQLVVIEAKIGSALSTGIKHAPNYDQAARTVACMAHMLDIAGLKPKSVDYLGFYVIAPESQIAAGIFGDLVMKGSISRKVASRVAQYQGQWDAWLAGIFKPALDRMDIAILSWESVLDVLQQDEEVANIRDFYSLCLKFNPV